MTIKKFDDETPEMEAALPAKEEILMNEDALLAGMLEASDFKTDEAYQKKIQIKRKDRILFEFRIRPLEEEEIQDCLKKSTKMLPNPNGRHLPRVEGDTDYVQLRNRKIWMATVEADRVKTWSNPMLKTKLGQKFNRIFTEHDVIDAVLMAGEKSWLCDLIDEISGYDDPNRVTQEDYAKN